MIFLSGTRKSSGQVSSPLPARMLRAARSLASQAPCGLVPPRSALPRGQLQESMEPALHGASICSPAPCAAAHAVGRKHCISSFFCPTAEKCPQALASSISSAQRHSWHCKPPLRDRASGELGDMKCPKWEAQGLPQLLVLAWSRNGKAVKCQGSPCSLCAEARAAHSPGGAHWMPPRLCGTWARAGGPWLRGASGGSWVHGGSRATRAC